MAYKVFTNGSVLNASEINDNLMRQAVAVFSNAAARTAAITVPVEGQVTFLEDTDQLFIYNGSAWQVIATTATNAYSYVRTIYYTSSNTFTKASFPWLRAIRVKALGAGGAGGGATVTGAAGTSKGGGGGAGGFGEWFSTDIAGLDASVTITIGAGGTGVSAAAGNAGGNTSFGALAIGNGGNGGQIPVSGSTDPALTSPGGTGGSATGTIGLPGSPGSFGMSTALADFRGFSGTGGSSALAGGAIGTNVTGNGSAAGGFGSGGSGGYNQLNQATARVGGAGSNGILIVELYA